MAEHRAASLIGPADALVRRAGELLVRMQDDPLSVSRKELRDVVTAADLASEALVIDGLDNRSLAARLGISPRTVEVHKSRLMAKLGARNLAELIRIAHAAGRLK